MPEKPAGLALILCDQIIIEKETEKKSLIGQFSVVNATSFPALHPKLSLFVLLTNGNGIQQISVRCCKEGETEKLFSLAGEVEFDNPQQIVELCFNLSNLVFLAPGMYVFEVSAEGEYIFERRILAKLIGG